MTHCPSSFPKDRIVPTVFGDWRCENCIAKSSWCRRNEDSFRRTSDDNWTARRPPAIKYMRWQWYHSVYIYRCHVGGIAYTVLAAVYRRKLACAGKISRLESHISLNTRSTKTSTLVLPDFQIFTRHFSFTLNITPTWRRHCTWCSSTGAQRGSKGCDGNKKQDNGGRNKYREQENHNGK